MPAKRTRRKRKPYQAENVGPTPETEAKLEADPLQAIVEAWVPETLKQPCERAAEEIRAVYGSVTSPLWIRPPSWARDSIGHYEVPEALAEAHAARYLPWVLAVTPPIARLTINVVVERCSIERGQQREVALSLADYARRF